MKNVFGIIYIIVFCSMWGTLSRGNSYGSMDFFFPKPWTLYPTDGSPKDISHWLSHYLRSTPTQLTVERMIPGIYTVSPIQLLTKSENPTIKNPFLKDNIIFKKRKEKPIVLKSNTKLKSNIKPEPSLMTVESKAF